MNTSSRTVLAVATTALLTLAASCGDDDDSADDTTAPTVAAAATEGAAATTEAAASATAAPATTAATTTAATAATAGAAATTAGSTPSGSEAPAGSAPAGGEVEIATADSDLGTILVDGEGRTLYLFLPDEQGGESTCFEQCAENWPPLVGTATAADDVTAELTTTTRSDGSGEQVVYNDWPLYYFASDAAPGDTNGQGLGDNWYVVSPDGEPIDND